MAKKRFQAEQIIGKLREAEVEISKGQTIGQIVKKLGVTEQTYYRWLLNGIERMLLTEKPPWNVERTLLTSGALDALLLSLQRGQQQIEAPYLMVPYRPTWRWQAPPPPPPMRPWAEQ